MEQKIRNPNLARNNKAHITFSIISCVRLFVTPWTVAYQAPLSMGFSRQECWSGLPFPSPGDLPNPGIELSSPALQADALPSEPPGKPRLQRKGEFPLGKSDQTSLPYSFSSPLPQIYPTTGSLENLDVFMKGVMGAHIFFFNVRGLETRINSS